MKQRYTFIRDPSHGELNRTLYEVKDGHLTVPSLRGPREHQVTASLSELPTEVRTPYPFSEIAPELTVAARKSTRAVQRAPRPLCVARAVQHRHALRLEAQSRLARLLDARGLRQSVRLASSP